MYMIFEIDLVQLGALSEKFATRIEQYAKCVQNTYLTMKADNENMKVYTKYFTSLKKVYFLTIVLRRFVLFVFFCSSLIKAPFYRRQEIVEGGMVFIRLRLF